MPREAQPERICGCRGSGRLSAVHQQPCVLLRIPEDLQPVGDFTQELLLHPQFVAEEVAFVGFVPVGEQKGQFQPCAKFVTGPGQQAAHVRVVQAPPPPGAVRGFRGGGGGGEGVVSVFVQGVQEADQGGSNVASQISAASPAPLALTLGDDKQNLACYRSFASAEGGIV
eukprot:CAMPEP_0113307596 /NCGR_PEP_ID=MMETSP0010_2-20120614/6378_1 /TAXON_ID=216773 ORGANISM="Corethron hystrix, Strain 308" /NCGR_SAMPLE_ID=MMETSP0010_2 /ASSEMBLY_ACC=CAM_ASM_000155 /LENGTH=169 /DNA_ID=CAMNT_0000162483 /DNA_START=1009 /DNA_END=1516 /DNA_ORIENTATION=- /assembly_acc=CAM_ASM_000155